MSQFVHLHVHTQYSILDGASDIKKLVNRAKTLGMGALAITDHGNMFGVKEFHDVATKAGVKPILGCEVYVVKNRREKDKDEKAGDHLILLAKNLNGYHNLIKIVSYSWTEGFYYKPRIDKELLRQFGQDIICCSACLGGEVPQAIMKGNINEASTAIEEFKDIFGEDYYLEMQLHPSGDVVIDQRVLNNQRDVNRVILELATKHSVKCIASNDVHFVAADDAPAHDRLICLNMGRDFDDPDRMRYTYQEYLKGYDEMAQLFANNLDALANTLEIAGKIDTYSLDHAPLMPNFPIPDDFVIPSDKLHETFIKKITDTEVLARVDAAESLDSFVVQHPEFEDLLLVARQFRYLEHLTMEGAKKRWQELTPELLERIEFELKTIEWMGFPGYFLIVWDFIRAAREIGVSVGPGRGSAAGSVVAYCLKITNIDPIKYNLLFERFLNPDRISLPDVDIDFDEDGRAEVLHYVVQKYGQKRVAQIITFGTMAPKMAIRDVARVQKLPLQESDRLAKLVPERPGTSFEAAYKEVPELQQERDSPNKLIRDTLLYAEKLEGSVRQTGVHACGVIIGKDDLENYAPMAVAKDAELNVVQYEGTKVESVGLIKMDFLGLKTLSIIKDAIENILDVRGVEIDIDTIPLDDAPTYELYSRGETTGLFQFESPGMKKHLRSLKPDRFEDLIAMNALYRPGPMEYIPNFINRKNGTEAVVYEIADMEEYLSDTYGITVYQEQVMLLSRKLAGFTGGQADTLRKAMGKKQREVLDKLKPQFIEGATAKGHDTTILDKIWGDWEAFASYAFNKSHSTCYAYVSYQTAYLKANYPSEFMAALLSRNISDIKKISLFMEECKRMGTQVMGPNVNASSSRFVADIEGNIRFGMAAIKGVGHGAVQAIVDERKANGKFESIYDFVERVNLQSVNKKTFENLAIAGAFDDITNFPRSCFFTVDPKDGATFIEQLVRYGSKMQNERDNSQQSLFGQMQSMAGIQRPQPATTADEWTNLERLNKEREMIGIYLSAHPLDDYKVLVKSFCNTDLGEFENLAAIKGRDFILAGMVTSVQNLTTKTGKAYGRFTVEDYGGSYQFTLFSKDYENFRKYLFEGYYLLIKGKVQPKSYNENEIEPRVNSMMQLSEAQETMFKEMIIWINVDQLNNELIEDLSALTKGTQGKTMLRMKVFDYEQNIAVGFTSKTVRIDVTSQLVEFLADNEIRYNIM